MSNISVPGEPNIWKRLDGANTQIRRRLDENLYALTQGKIARPDLVMGSGTKIIYDLSDNIRAHHRQADANALTRLEIDLATNSISAMRDAVRGTIDQVMTVYANSEAAANLGDIAREGISKLTSLVNLEIGSRFILNGINSGAPPLKNYYHASPVSPQEIYRTEILEALFVNQDEYRWSDLKPDEVDAYLKNVHSTILTADFWNTILRNSSPSRMPIPIGLSSEVHMPSLDDLKGLRYAFSALIVISDLEISQMQYSSAKHALDYALGELGRAEHAFNSDAKSMALIGVDINNTSEQIQRNIALHERIKQDNLSADPLRSASEANELQVRLESLYSLASRLKNLFLARYL